jgi:hypothetical protein
MKKHDRELGTRESAAAPRKHYVQYETQKSKKKVHETFTNHTVPGTAVHTGTLYILNETLHI